LFSKFKAATTTDDLGNPLTDDVLIQMSTPCITQRYPITDKETNKGLASISRGYIRGSASD